MILAALLLMRDLRWPLFGEGRRHSRFWAPAAFILFLVVIGFEYRFIRQFDVLRVAEGETVFPDACRWAESKVPPHSLVVSIHMSGALKYYTGLTTVGWDCEPEKVLLLQQRAREHGYQWFALLFPLEIPELEKRLPWGWTRVGTFKNATLWRAEPGPDLPRARGARRRGRRRSPQTVEGRSPLSAVGAAADGLAVAQSVADASQGLAPGDRREAVGGIEADRRPVPVDAGSHRAVGADDIVAVRIGAPVQALVAAVAPVLPSVDPGADLPEPAAQPRPEGPRPIGSGLELGIGGQPETPADGVSGCARGSAFRSRGSSSKSSSEETSTPTVGDTKRTSSPRRPTAARKPGDPRVPFDSIAST